MHHDERQSLWNEPAEPRPSLSHPGASQAPARSNFWKPLGIGVLVGTLFIGAPLGGVTGGIVGGFAMTHWAGTRTTTASVPNPLPVHPVVVATNTDLTAIYERTVPSVVQVNARGSRGGGLGSGFVVDGAGRILTNHHVIDGASSITVRFNNGTEVPARVLGRDPAGDLALLEAQIPAEVLPLPLADSDQVKPGEVAIAIGSPQGLGYSITAGIVSGIDRTAGAGGGRPLSGLIQTDAAINPGNSGGPLLNGRGEVIGINTLGSTGVQNIGFAVPINAARRLLPRLIAGEVIQHAWLGISAATTQASVTGVEVAEVVAGSPAARGGLARGDIITKVAGTAVRDVGELRKVLEEQRVGQTITIEYTRGGRAQSTEVTLQAWPTQTRS